METQVAKKKEKSEEKRTKTRKKEKQSELGCKSLYVFLPPMSSRGSSPFLSQARSRANRSDVVVGQPTLQAHMMYDLAVASAYFSSVG